MKMLFIHECMLNLIQKIERENYKKFLYDKEFHSEFGKLPTISDIDEVMEKIRQLREILNNKHAEVYGYLFYNGLVVLAMNHREFIRIEQIDSSKFMVIPIKDRVYEKYNDVIRIIYNTINETRKRLGEEAVGRVVQRVLDNPTEYRNVVDAVFSYFTAVIGSLIYNCIEIVGVEHWQQN
jgi:hypothetical protein